jgi:hypothetical protein
MKGELTIQQNILAKQHIFNVEIINRDIWTVIFLKYHGSKISQISRFKNIIFI